MFSRDRLEGHWIFDIGKGGHHGHPGNHHQRHFGPRRSDEDEGFRGRSRANRGEDGGSGHGGRHGRNAGFGGGMGRGIGGRLFGPGEMQLVLLALIAEQPRHGYELIKAIEQQFNGAYAPSPGTIYPTLNLLEELGHISGAASEGSKKRFEITDLGQQFLVENRVAVEATQSRMTLAARAISGRTIPDAIVQSMQTLRMALAYHTDGWSDQEVRRVQLLLDAATKSISEKDPTSRI